MPTRALTRALLLLALLVGVVVAPLASAAPKEEKPGPGNQGGGGPKDETEQVSTFQGECPDAGGPCTIDEPEGNNAATHGTVTHERETDLLGGDLLRFVIRPEAAVGAAAPTVTGVQVCVTAAAEGGSNPYVPTNANTCSGSSPTRVWGEAVPDGNTIEIDLVEEGFDHGGDVYFALHINLRDGNVARTTYVTGLSHPEELTEQLVTSTLTVMKTVRGGAGDERFPFTVDCGTPLGEGNAPGDPDVTYVDGNGTFLLGDGASQAFSGIPATDSCTVAETAVPTADWTTTVDGVVVGDRAATYDMTENRTAAFVNELVPEDPPVLYTLTVTNDVPPDSEAFAFTVSCGGAQVAQFDLGDGTQAVPDIPAGTECRITETPPAGDWSTTVNGVADPDRIADVVMGADQTVAFVNTAQTVEGGDAVLESLTVSKRVAGGAGETFPFTVDCGELALSTVNGDEAEYEGGDATFELGDGGVVTVDAIPAGAVCTVTEEIPAGAWTTTIGGVPAPDRTTEVTVDEDVVVAFVNTATTVAGAGGQQPAPPEDGDGEDDGTAPPGDGDGAGEPGDGTGSEGDGSEGDGTDDGSDDSGAGEPGDGDGRDPEVAGATFERGPASLAATGLGIAVVTGVAATLVAAGLVLARAGRIRP